MNLEDEALEATKLLKDKVVLKVFRPRKTEVCIEFTDGTELYVHKITDGVELSIT